MWKGAAVYFVTYGAAICLQEFWLANIPGIVRYLMMIVVGLLLYFGPSVAMAYYIVTTTTVSEFVAVWSGTALPVTRKSWSLGQKCICIYVLQAQQDDI